MVTIEGVEYLDGDEAAAQLGVKKTTLYAYVSRGVLHSFRQAVGRKRLYRRDVIERLREVRPSDAPNTSAAPPTEDDTVGRDVRLPNAASWAGEH